MGEGGGRREGGDGVLGRWRLRSALLVFVYASVRLSSARSAAGSGTSLRPDDPCTYSGIHMKCFGEIPAAVC